MAGRPRSPCLAVRPPLPAPSLSRLLLVPQASRAPPPAARPSSLFPSTPAVASTGASPSTERRLPCSLVRLHVRRPSSHLARGSPPRRRPPARARHAASPRHPQPPRRPLRLPLPSASISPALPSPAARCWVPPAAGPKQLPPPWPIFSSPQTQDKQARALFPLLFFFLFPEIAA
ncbi:hypothetical protein BRADI_5g00330v3 [Brachypodium distachyon]|uniref:Uncharacterized protein n=1 Tax=Brachypodium distachyon TaxID=15368 RepID=A0A0Q3H048_BRADI|nr:hypothetical protein BRADI_5g00330v3 [Brachypodium distachyon]